MMKLTLGMNDPLLIKLGKSYEQKPDDEWSTRLKNVEIKGDYKSEASVTVIDGYDRDLVEINEETYRFKKAGAIVIVFADDTELFFGFEDLTEAVDFANKMITLLSTDDIVK